MGEWISCIAVDDAEQWLVSCVLNDNFCKDFITYKHVLKCPFLLFVEQCVGQQFV